jgi:hypothetical protein
MKTSQIKYHAEFYIMLLACCKASSTMLSKHHTSLRYLLVHLADPIAALKEMKRVREPDGFVVLATASRSGEAKSCSLCLCEAN